MPDEPQSAASTLNPDEEELWLPREFSNLQSCRESPGIPVFRDLRLSDLFISYAPDASEDPPPEGG